MTTPETNGTEQPRVCALCGITSQGHRIDFYTHCGLTEEWRYSMCTACDDLFSDFRMTIAELIETRERQMHRNRTSYARRPSRPARQRPVTWGALL